MNLPKVKAVLFKGKVYADGTHPIMIRVTKDRVSTYKATGFSVPENAWDTENHLVFEKKPVITKGQEGQLKEAKILQLKELYKKAQILTNAGHINSVISNMIGEIGDISQKLKINNESLKVGNIKAKISPEKGGDQKKNFIVYGEYMRDKYIKSGSLLTAKRYTMVLNKLSEYIGKLKLDFETIDLKFLQQYEAHLFSKQQKGEKVFQYKINTVNNHFKTIKAIFFNAMKEGLVDANKNPFFFFKLKAESNVKKEKLSVEEIIAIEKLQLDEHSLIWNVRNYFLFSFYCAGIRISDLIQLKWSNITKDGRIEYKMDKTGGYKSIVLIPKAEQILQKYKKSKVKQTDFVFPILDERVDLTVTRNLYNQLSAKTALINKYLKKVAAKAEIDKPLTTHIARHSFSDIARKKGANLYDISKMLGHSSIKITEAYLSNFDQESQDASLKNVLNF